MADGKAFAYAEVNPAVRSDRLMLSEMWVRMVPFHHDMAETVIQGVDDIDSARWTTGVPVKLTYGRPGQVGTFYGYVLSVERNWSQNQRIAIPGRTMVVRAIGASYWLKEDLTTVFLGMTSSQIALALARSHYLDTDIPATTYVWPKKASSGRSEWSFLVDLAKASGLILYCNGVQLRMYDPLLPLQRQNAIVPYFYEKDTSKNATVLTFENDVTEMSADEGRRKRSRVVKGLDGVTSQPVYLSQEPLPGAMGLTSLSPQFTETVTDLVATSQVAANALLGARNLENRFYIRAKASFSGDPRVTQMSPVVVEGLGARDSGLWQVIEATQHYRKYWFSTDCVLGRDADYDNGVRPGLPSGVVRARLDGSEHTPLTNPPTVLFNGQWRAAWLSSVPVAV